MNIIALTTGLPKNVYTTQQLIDKYPTTLPDSVKQNINNLGVRKRHLINPPDCTQLNEDALIELSTETCAKALKDADLQPEDINYLVATYDAVPYLSPGLGQLIMPTLGLNTNAHYTNAQGIASTAFPKALELASYYLSAHPQDHVLVYTSGATSYWFQAQVQGITNIQDTAAISKIADAREKQNELRKWAATIEYFLFGDGAAAAIVSSHGDEGLSIEKTTEVTNLAKSDYLAGYSKLTLSREPFKFGFHSHLDRRIPELGIAYTNQALDQLLGNDSRRVINEIKKWAVHTGSLRILDRVEKEHQLKHDRLEESRQVLSDYGNLAGASLPFILEKIDSQARLAKGDITLMIGYGWGFSASATLIKKV